MNRFEGKRGKRLRPSRRARQIFGLGEDSGKYYRCQHCGFVCNIDRDELGGPADRDGLVYENYSVSIYPNPLGNGIIRMGGDIEHFQVVLENGSDDEPKEVEEHWRAVSVSGCPLCGSRNWLGRY
jgi:DNA-directed RNA polymerase subunit RPC12/RpoP